MNALQRRYVHGPGMDEAIVWYEGNGTTDRRFLSSDERGSIISLTDSAGALLGINKYDEYGNPQAGNVGTFGYTGQAWLSGPGIWYYKARVYDPELGRFLQTDPVGYAASPNLYAYVLNSPVSLTDPFGMLPGGSICNGINTCSINGVDAFEVYAAEKMALAEASGWSDSAEPNRARICLETGVCVTDAAWAGHDYPVGPFNVCPDTPSCRSAILDVFPWYIVPNLGQAVTDGQISPVYAVAGGYLKVGTVQTEIYSGGFAATNFTQPGHLLCCGQVDIWHSTGGGWIQVNAHGYGSNNPGIGIVNQAWGPEVFKALLGTYIMVVRSRLK